MSNSKLHPRQEALYAKLPPGTPQTVNIKNAKLNAPRLIHFSDLVLTCRGVDGKQRLVELPECKRLRLIKEYDAKTGRCVIRRKFKNEVTNKIEFKETTYDHVPEEWTYISHANRPDYAKFLKEFKEKQDKAESEAKSSGPKRSWPGKKAKKEAKMDYWSIESVVKADAEYCLVERTPLMKAGWGWKEWRHGDFAYDPLNKGKDYLKTKAHEVTWKPQLWTEAWPGGVEVNGQDPEALLFVAYCDLMHCAITEAIFTTNTSSYAAIVRDRATAAYDQKLEARIQGVIHVLGEKAVDAAKRDDVKAKFDKELAAGGDPETDLLMNFEQEFTSQAVKHDCAKFKTGRFGADKKEIVAKIPNPFSEQVEVECKLFRAATEDEIKAFEKLPYILNADISDPELRAYTAAYEKEEAEQLRLQAEAAEKKTTFHRRLMCPPSRICIDLWLVKDGKLIWDGPPVWRMAHVDDKGKTHKARELTWKEKGGALAKNAVVSAKIERSFMPHLNASMPAKIAKVKGKVLEVFLYKLAEPYTGGKNRRSTHHDDEEAVPGAQDVSVANFDEEALARASGTQLSEEDRKIMDAELAREKAAEEAKQKPAEPAAAAESKKRKEPASPAKSSEGPPQKKAKTDAADDDEAMPSSSAIAKRKAAAAKKREELAAAKKAAAATAEASDED